MTLVTARRTLTAATCAAALVLAAPVTADAKGQAETVRLVPPDHSPDADAAGKVKIVHRKKGDRMIVRVKKLAPRTTFEVLDADTDESLGTLRTNRRGRGRLVLTEGRARRGNKVAQVEALPDDVEIVEEGGDVCVLEMEGAPPLVGTEHYEGPEGHLAWISLVSIPAPELPADVPRVMLMPDIEMEDLECFLLSLVPPPEEGERFSRVTYELFLDSLSGDEMPLGVPHAADLAERAFEIRDGDGNVWIAGHLPAVEPLEWRLPDMPGPPEFPLWEEGEDAGGFQGPPGRMGGGMMIAFDTAEGDVPNDRPPADGPPDGEADRPGWDGPVRDFPAPEESDVTIWIADEDGVLTEAGNLYRLELPEWECPPHDGADGPTRPGPGDGTDGGDGNVIRFGFGAIR